MTLIFGIGIGTFLVITLWAIAIVLCCISQRTNSNIGSLFIVCLSLLMLVFYLVPKGPETPELSVEKIHDPLLIWRFVLTVILALFSISGSIFFFVNHVMEQRFAQHVKTIRCF